MKCPECNVEYPERLLNPLVTSLGTTNPICGICALEIVNELHDQKRESFNTPIAERMRQDALKWRKDHAYYQ
jgi:hypothetical protein